MSFVKLSFNHIIFIIHFSNVERNFHIGNSNFETMKLKTSIIRVETTINFIFWFCSVSYAIYETYQVGNRNYNSIL